MEENKNTETGLEIAVIGMAGRFPGAKDIETFWENLKNGVESVSFLSDEELERIDPGMRENPNYVSSKGGYLEGMEYFDASFFDYTPLEAETMAPQMRIFHECAWEAFENAGYDPGAYSGLTGFYVGVSSSTNWELLVRSTSAYGGLETYSSFYLKDRDFLSTLISYKFNLNGPAFSMHTACSTSLVAIHLACQGLLTGDCDMALAGGIAVRFEDDKGYIYQEGMILSPDGHCRAFDADAGGTVGGNGAGIVVLKRLEDALLDRDHIYAVIKGSAINNDGNQKVGYTAPSIEGQMEVIRRVYKMAEVHPEDISYVETHGTATALGDVTEIEALKLAFDSDKKHFCGLGSVKTNIGHLDTAAGAAGFIKTVLALKHQLMPPSLHFKAPNPKIDFENSPFYVNAALKEWKTDGKPLRAGVSSFGIGGTNAHVVLEAWSMEHGAGDANREHQLMTLSAKTPSALENMTENLAFYFKENPVLPDAAYTLQVGRRGFKHRAMLVASCAEEAVDILKAPENLQVHLLKEERKNIVFMFPGQGSQYVNMALDLYRKEPVFREEMDRCFEILEPLMDYNIKEILYPDDLVSKVSKDSRGEVPSPAYDSPHSPHLLKINQTEIAQPVIFIIEYALAKLLIKWGIQPYAMIGHSIGEYTAACLAGVFSLADALGVVALRGRLMQELPEGAMLGVPIPAEELKSFLNDEVSLAAVNSPSHCVVSGTREAVAALEKELMEKGYQCRRLHTSHAFHSGMMDPIIRGFEDRMARVTLNRPGIPYVSNVTGKWIAVKEAANPGYWGRHLRQTVRFSDGVTTLLKKSADAALPTVFVEIGPGKVLSTFVRKFVDGDYKNKGHQVVNLLRRPQEETPDDRYLLSKIGRLWLYGVDIDWAAYYGEEKRYRVPLPTYPFEKKRFWKLVEDYEAGKISLHPGLQPAAKKQDLSGCFYVPAWKRRKIQKNEREVTGEKLNWLIFMDDPGLGERLVERLKEGRQYQVAVVRMGAGYTKKDKMEFVMNSKQYEDYETILEELHSTGFIPSRIIHLWGVTGKNRQGEPGFIEECLGCGFYSLLHLVKALGKNPAYAERIEINVVTDFMQDVSGEESLHPAKAAVLGPCLVIPQEYPNIICKSIDMNLPPTGDRQYREQVDQLIDEITIPPGGMNTDTVVAYRGNHRWVQAFESVSLPDRKESPLLRQGGVYLITGGLGGIGHTLAEYLIKTVGARVILTGRSDISSKGRKEKLQQLENMGGEVVYFCADVADKDRMREVIRESKDRFGRIDGVIHSAGFVKADAFNSIQEIAITQCQGQFQAKLYGLLVLEELLQDEKLDFCLMISSIATVLGGLGFVAYAAANHFIDAFSIQHNRKNREPWIVVDWDGASKEETARGFQLIFASGSLLEQVVFSNGRSLEERIAQWVKPDRKDKESDIDEAASTAMYARPELPNPYVAPRNSPEEKLVDIWQRFLGIEQIGITDDLFDLGGDSLKAVNILSLVHKEFNVTIPIQEFFNHPTIEGAAKYLTGAEKETYVAIEPAEKKEYYPLSSAQKRLVVFQQVNPESIAYNFSTVEILEGQLDRERLHEVFKRLLERHEILRTSLEMVNEVPVQRIHESLEFEVASLPLPPGDTASIINQFIQPFDLSRAPLLRVGLVKLEEKKHLLMVDMHHIVTDAVSLALFEQEFIAIYEGKPLVPLEFQYKDYAEWQNSEAQNRALKDQEKYWLNEFKEEIPVLDVPTDFPRPLLRGFEGDKINFSLSKEKTGRLKELAKKEGGTLFMVLLAISNILLSKLSGQEDIVLGVPIAGRRHADLERIIGMFVNTLALRNFPAGEKTFMELLADVRERTLKAFENQDYQLEDLVEQVVVNRDTSRNPLFDVLFVMENVELLEINIPGLKVKRYDYENATAKFDISLYTNEGDGALWFTLEYCTRLFKPETIDRFIKYYNRIVSIVLDNPGIRLSEIEMISEGERRLVLVDFNDTEFEYPAGKTIHELFEETVGRDPGNIALVYENQEITYRRLKERADQLAVVLRGRGTRDGDIVAIMVERSIEMVVGILAILKAGGAYLPIDPGYPEERITYMLKDSGAKVLLTNLPEGRLLFNCQLLMSSPETPLHHSSFVEIPHHSDIAYVIYTSGSTGKPKGVMVEHGAAVNLLDALQKLYPFTPSDVYLLKTAYIFDVSVTELFGWFMGGGRLAVLPKGEEKEPEKIIEKIERCQVTHINFVPSMFNIFVDYLDQQDVHRLSSLKYIFLAGEALAAGLVKKFNQLDTNIPLENLYGPTEATVYAGGYSLSHWDEQHLVPIGKPLQNVKLHILDKNNHLQPLGVPGELCIAGKGLARGYLNRPELTAEKFNRSYKTGDLARWLPCGNVEFLGRIDHQVKIRGFRIELGEVESHLLAHEGIKEALVTARKDESGDTYLCAYIVPSTPNLREYLSQRLPEYMVPSFFIPLEGLPLTPGGKVDRRALPGPDRAGLGEVYTPPTNDVEEKMAVIWAGVLGIEKERIGIDNNFFDLGGHSLKATILTAKIHKMFGVKVPQAVIFRDPTIRKLSRSLSIEPESGQVRYEPIEAAEKKEYYPLSSAQGRFYILQQVTPESTAYNMTAVHLLEGRVEKEKFEEALGKLINRHETLRTSFQLIEGRPVQRIDETVDFGVEVPAHINDFVRAFELSRPPLLRLGLIKLAEDRYVLMFDMHHIISDGTSLSIFLREFMGLYPGGDLPLLPLQYKDFAQWQYDRVTSGKLEKEEAYWLERFSGELPVLDMPTDFPRPVVQRFDGDRFDFTLEPSLTRDLNHLIKETGATLFILLLTVYHILLSRYTGREDIIIGTAIAGRPHPDLENIIGLLMETLVLRNFSRGDSLFGQFLEQVKQDTLEAFDNQDYPFKELIRQVGAENEISRNPVFDAMLIVQNLEFTDLELEGLRFSPYEIPEEQAGHMSKVDFTIEAMEAGEGIHFSLEYCTALYKRETMERFAHHFINIIKEVVKEPGLQLSAIRMISEEEKKQLLEEFNTGPMETGEGKPVFQRFEDQVHRTPDHIALFDQCFITYRQLNDRADYLAYLLQEKGAGPDTVVGILVEPSLDMVIGLLGILKSGGAYLPIEPDYPKERIEYMLNDSGVKILLTNLSEGHHFNCQLSIVNCQLSMNTASNSPTHLTCPAHLCYVIYTSGTTGRPKGVLVEHGNLSAYIHAFEQEFELGPGDTVIRQVSYAFDAFVEELYPILLKGGKLVIPGKEVTGDIDVLCHYIARQRVTFITCSPQLLNELNQYPALLGSLRLMISGADRLKAEYIGNLLEIGEVYNTYGPTEATVCATYYRCSPGDGENPPIGKPISNYKVYILDQKGSLLPIGVPGELYISGAGVARGYLNNVELTSEKFINKSFAGVQGAVFQKSPLAAGGPLYRTGDLACWLEDGAVEFLGRIDRQVKIRGYRIELGEIESRLTALESIKEVVVVEGERVSGQNYLAAYVVCEGPLDAAEVKQRLALQLPDYMIPSFIVELDEIPLTPSGKVDRKRLPRPDAPSERPYAAPVSQKEKRLADIWKEVLEVERVGLDDNFFDLGGTSLDIFKINSQIDETFEKKVAVVALFQHTTVRSLARYLDEESGETGISEEKQKELSDAVEKGKETLKDRAALEIAVIGMAGRFPGARSIDEFWENLKNGVEGISYFTEEELLAEGINAETIKNPGYIKARGIIAGAEYFDDSFFGYTPMEAQLMDPQMRIFTQCVWHALEDAGCDPSSYPRRIGLYAGASPNLQWEGLSSYASVSQGLSGFMVAQLVDKDFMCTHIAYKLNLKGPSVSIQTACSTSLVAIHHAVQGLLLGECEMALAGGVSIAYPLKQGYLYQEGMIYSDDGHNRTFDAAGKGSVFGDGVGVVVLKRLEDAVTDRDHIWAVIKGSAINNDGFRKVGYTAPSIEGQVEVIRTAQLMAEVEPESITYIEAHGTATPLGDTVEIEALKQAFNTDKKRFCGIGTVKSNMGHLYSAAGVTGFIKTTLALKHRLIPPSLHFRTPNPQINFENSPFYVVTEPTAWENNGHPLRAGVSSFGIGGTNAHVVMEETPVSEVSKVSGEYQLILLSAATHSALNKMTENLVTYLKNNPVHPVNPQNPVLPDIAYTLQVGRKHLPYRRMLVTAADGVGTDEDAEKLALAMKSTRIVTAKQEQRPVIFMICGQGSQYVNMGIDLYRTEKIFREEMDRCFAILKSLTGTDFKEILYTDAGNRHASSLHEQPATRPDVLNQTEITQPVLFAFEYALARLLIQWGIQPTAMIGYSFGEYIAACLAGVFSLADALALVIIRGQLVQRTPAGAMASVPLPEDQLKPLLKEEKNVELAIINGPTCIVSGTKEAVAAFEKKMKQKRILCVPVNMSHAIHSQLMSSIRGELENRIREFRLNEPQIPFISNVTAQWLSNEDAVNPGYWGDHLCSTVRFSGGLKELLQYEDAIFIEIGPGRILGMMVRTHPDRKPGHLVLNTVKHPQERVSDDYFLLDKVGQLWLQGQRIDWNAFYREEKRYRVPLPGYPFEGKRYWLDVDTNGMNPLNPKVSFKTQTPPVSEAASDPGLPGSDYQAPRDEMEQKIARMWQELMGIERVGIHDDFFELNGSSLVATQILVRLTDEYKMDVPVNRFYETPTIAHLAEVIRESQEERNKED